MVRVCTYRTHVHGGRRTYTIASGSKKSVTLHTLRPRTQPPLTARAMDSGKSPRRGSKRRPKKLARILSGGGEGGAKDRTKRLPPTPPPKLRSGADRAAEALSRATLAGDDRVEEVLYTAWWYDECRRVARQRRSYAAHGGSSADPDGDDPAPAPESAHAVQRAVEREVLAATPARRLRGRWVLYKLVHGLYYATQGVASTLRAAATVDYYWAMIHAVWHDLEVGVMYHQLAAWRAQLPLASASTLRELYVLRAFYRVVAQHGTQCATQAMDALARPVGGAHGELEAAFARVLEAAFWARLAALRRQRAAAADAEPLAGPALRALVARAVVACRLAVDAGRVHRVPLQPLRDVRARERDDDGSLTLADAALMVRSTRAALAQDRLGAAVCALALELDGEPVGYVPRLLAGMRSDAAQIAQRVEVRTRSLAADRANAGAAGDPDGDLSASVRAMIVCNHAVAWAERARAHVRQESLDQCLQLDVDVEGGRLASALAPYDRLIAALERAARRYRGEASLAANPATSGARAPQLAGRTRVDSVSDDTASSPPRRRLTSPARQRGHERQLSRRTASRALASPCSSPSVPTLARSRSRSFTHALTSSGLGGMTRSSSAETTRGMTADASQ